MKLADFGFATKLSEEAAARQSLVGTTHWMAPEMLTRRGYDSKVEEEEAPPAVCLCLLTKQSCRWTCGVWASCCWKCATGSRPSGASSAARSLPASSTAPSDPRVSLSHHSLCISLCFFFVLLCAVPEDWSNELLSFASLCLTKEPLLRADVAALLEHPFLASAPRRPASPRSAAPRIEEALGL